MRQRGPSKARPEFGFFAGRAGARAKPVASPHERSRHGESWRDFVASPVPKWEKPLVVDDEPSVRMLVVDVLEEPGYLAIEAADGASGLKVLQSDARIYLLVSGIGLPGGMNGRQMADAARVDRPDLKVLFITGYADNAAVGGQASGACQPPQIAAMSRVMDAISPVFSSI